MATFRTPQCQDGEEVLKCYEWRCQGMKRLCGNINTHQEGQILTGILSRHSKNSKIKRILRRCVHHIYRKVFHVDMERLPVQPKHLRLYCANLKWHRNLSKVWRSTSKSTRWSFALICYRRRVVPKSSFLCVDKSPIRNDFVPAYLRATRYSMLPSIRTVPVSGHLKQKLNFWGAIFSSRENDVFRMKAERFSFKMKVLAISKLAKQSRKTPFCSGE